MQSDVPTVKPKQKYRTNFKRKNISEMLWPLYTNFNEIQITPVELLGFQTHADLQNASEDTLSDVVISISQLYEFVKIYDKKTNAIECPDREAETEV